jgi:hypothetical protein
MLHRYCFALLSFVSVAPCNSASIGAQQSDYVLNLQPPEITAQDIESSLAAIMKAEDEKHRLSDSEFEMAKQRLINVEKQRLRDIVRNSFASVA